MSNYSLSLECVLYPLLTVVRKGNGKKEVKTNLMWYRRWSFTAFHASPPYLSHTCHHKLFITLQQKRIDWSRSCLYGQPPHCSMFPRFSHRREIWSLFIILAAQIPPILHVSASVIWGGSEWNLSNFLAISLFLSDLLRLSCSLVLSDRVDSERAFAQWERRKKSEHEDAIRVR